jgi:hypothetical protein
MVDDFSEGALANAIHENFHSLLRLMCRYTPGFEWVEGARATLMVCDSPTSIYNRVIKASLGPTNIVTQIREVVDFYSSRRLPFLWMIGPRDTPIDLPRHLEEYGFVKSGAPGMAVDLSKLNAPGTPAGLTISRVVDEEQLIVFSELMPGAFGFDGLTREAVTRWIRDVGIRSDLRH